MFLYYSHGKEREAMLESDNTGQPVEPDNISKTTIGDTTYIVSSFYKKNAKCDVIDKIRRLIECESEVENAA